MELTRQEAIAKHREMWHKIAKATRELKRIVRKWEVIDDDEIKNLCYMCEYDSQMREKCTCVKPDCYFCPLDIPENSRCLNGLYTEWADCEYTCDYEKAVELAELIANLPEVNFNDVEVWK